MITIQELLYNRGLDPNAKVKLVRHKDSRQDLYDLYRYNKNEFLDYQKSQKRDVFHGVDYVVSFIGEKGKLSRFVGVYKKLGNGVLRTDGHFWYEMEEVAGFEDLKERVIIDWGKSRMFHQWISNIKEVVEIQPGLHYQQFTDYFDFVLDFKQLKEIVTNEYSDWKKMLSITKGIYLISDSKTGKLYVGSAYGDNGIWGRWARYVATNGHGDNKTLKELVSMDSNYAFNFRFSILMLLPRTVTPDQAILKENLFKKKLGTNACGLNNN